MRKIKRFPNTVVFEKSFLWHAAAVYVFLGLFTKEQEKKGQTKY